MSKTKDTLSSAYRWGGPSFGERRTATVLTDINTNRQTPVHWLIRWLRIVNGRRRETILEKKNETEKHTELGRTQIEMAHARTEHERHTHHTTTAHELTTGRAGRHCLRRVLLCPAARNSWRWSAAGVVWPPRTRSVRYPHRPRSDQKILRKREHATPPSTATRNRPRRRLEQEQGQTAAAGTCLRFAARDVLGWAFVAHRERSVSAYGNNDDGADEGRRGHGAVYYFYTPRRKRRQRRRRVIVIRFSRFFYGPKGAMIRILIFLNSKAIGSVRNVRFFGFQQRYETFAEDL